MAQAVGVELGLLSADLLGIRRAVGVGRVLIKCAGACDSASQQTSTLCLRRRSSLQTPLALLD